MFVTFKTSYNLKNNTADIFMMETFTKDYDKIYFCSKYDNIL